MEKLKQLWEYFNGKKSVIGGAILTFAFFVNQFDQQVLIGYWHIVNPIWYQPLLDTVDWFGAVLGGVGIIHKAVKN